MLLLLASVAVAWPLRGPDGVPAGTEVQAPAYFAPADLPDLPLSTSPADLGAVAGATLAYLDRTPDDPAVTAGLFSELGVDLDDVRRTLAFVARVAAEDAGASHQRLQDPDFLAAHFDWYAWTPDRERAAARGLDLPADRIRLTRYLVFQVEGRATPEQGYAHALYAPPADLDPTTYTRQEVMAGVYTPGGAAAGRAEPLVHLSAQGVYDALMQGTIEVRLPGGPPRLFNVEVHNGIPYDPAVRDPGKQARYWYFREVNDVLGWGDIPVRPGATVAGDIYNLGLGKLVGLRTTSRDGKADLRLAVLADTGGAFQPNLFQLDYLAGTFPDLATFRAATAHLPGTVQAGVLILRDAAAAP